MDKDACQDVDRGNQSSLQHSAFLRDCSADILPSRMRPTSGPSHLQKSRPSSESEDASAFQRRPSSGSFGSQREAFIRPASGPLRRPMSEALALRPPSATIKPLRGIMRSNASSGDAQLSGQGAAAGASYSSVSLPTLVEESGDVPQTPVRKGANTSPARPLEQCREVNLSRRDAIF